LHMMKDTTKTTKQQKNHTPNIGQHPMIYDGVFHIRN
jgi:hypothetical protein